MKKVLFVLLCVAFFASMAMAQVTYTAGTGNPIGKTSPIDKLGAHENGGRGCVGCHAPHSGAAGNGGNVSTGSTVDTANAGNDALWGQDLGSALWLHAEPWATTAHYVTTLPASTSFRVADEEIRGIMMCLSCHDGNIAKGAMMTNKSWEQAGGSSARGLRPATPIPTLLGNDGTAAGNYNNDHPVGPQATLGAVGVASRFTVTGGTLPTPTLLATTDAQYLEFIGNYGAPTFSGRTPPVLPSALLTAALRRMRTSFAPPATLRTPCTPSAPAPPATRSLAVIWTFPELLLHRRSLQPELATRLRQPGIVGNAVLPSVPLHGRGWIERRLEHSRRYHRVLVRTLNPGGGKFPSPSFTAGEEICEFEFRITVLHCQ